MECNNIHAYSESQAPQGQCFKYLEISVVLQMISAQALSVLYIDPQNPIANARSNQEDISPRSMSVPHPGGEQHGFLHN